MPKFDLVLGGAPVALAEQFEVGYVNHDGQQRLPLTGVWSVPIEFCQPVRGFPSYKGQRNHVGHWWTSYDGRSGWV
ncbi:MAG: hypothetical protein K2Q25_15660 [Mycobacteriaceae bacterium]|nr:hypothetical protein [Mycobacteriaceae bacterium]